MFKYLRPVRQNYYSVDNLANVLSFKLEIDQKITNNINYLSRY